MFRRIIAVIITLLMLAGFAGITAYSEAVSVRTFDPGGTYMAYIQIQSENRIFRNTSCQAEFGINGFEWTFNGGTHPGSHNVMYSEDTGVHTGVFHDTQIRGNGTYRVSATGLDLARTCDFFNILGVSTDIPLEGFHVTFSNVKVIMDGSIVYEFDSTGRNTPIIHGIDTPIPGNLSNYVMQPIFIWNDSLPKFSYTMPTDVEIEFTISGFNYDLDASVVVPQPPATPAYPDRDDDDNRDRDRDRDDDDDDRDRNRDRDRRASGGAGGELELLPLVLVGVGGTIFGGLIMALVLWRKK